MLDYCKIITNIKAPKTKALDAIMLIYIVFINRHFN